MVDALIKTDDRVFDTYAGGVTSWRYSCPFFDCTLRVRNRQKPSLQKCGARSRTYRTVWRTHEAAGETNVPLNAKAIVGVEHRFTLAYKSLILESRGE